MHWASDGGAEGSAVDTGSGKGSRAPHLSTVHYFDATPQLDTADVDKTG